MVGHSPVLDCKLQSRKRVIRNSFTVLNHGKLGTEPGIGWTYLAAEEGNVP